MVKDLDKTVKILNGFVQWMMKSRYIHSPAVERGQKEGVGLHHARARKQHGCVITFWS